MMYRSILTAVVLATVGWVPVQAQAGRVLDRMRVTGSDQRQSPTSGPDVAASLLQLDDQVRISSDQFSGEFTIAAVSDDAVSVLALGTSTHIDEITLRDGERIDLRELELEVGGGDLLLKGQDPELGDSRTVIRNWGLVQISERRIPLNEVQEVTLGEATLPFDPTSNTVHLPIKRIGKLEVSRGASGGSMLGGGLIGAIAGFALGGAVVDDLDGIPVALSAAVVGALAGAAIAGGERWEEITFGR